MFGVSISIDIDNNVLASYQISKNKTRLENDTIFSQYPADLLLLKINNSNGMVMWKKLIENPGDEIGLFIVPDLKGSFYLTGNFSADTFCIDNICLTGEISGINSHLFLAKFHQTPTGIEPIPFTDNTLTLFPNPAHETVSINNTNLQPNQIRVVDALGRTISVSITTTANQTQINTSSLPPGLYMVLVNDGNTILSAKMMKE